MGDGLKSMEEAWAEARRKDPIQGHYTKTGVACPECGEEVWAHFVKKKKVPVTAFREGPPAYAAHCPACLWRGFIPRKDAQVARDQPT